MPPRRRHKPIHQMGLPTIKEDELSGYETLPPIASTQEEIRIAVEQNAQDRGKLLLRVIVSLQIDALLEAIDGLAQSYDIEDFYQAAGDANIDPRALDHLRAQPVPVPFPYYFCLPDTFISRPDLVFYYRNVAMLSAKVMRGIGLDTQPFEARPHLAPDKETALGLARYLNGITGKLVMQGPVSPSRHIQMMMANVGDSMGGTARNEVGRAAMARVINPIIRRFHDQGRLAVIVYSLKGRITSSEDEDDNGALPQQRLVVTPTTDIDGFLARFEEYRVIYHELQMANYSRLLLNRQLAWTTPNGEVLRIGPDLHSQVGLVDMYWGAELKGGADPAGSDEHWKTATQALQRIREAAEKAGKNRPLLSFIATILVERVAREAQIWINAGILTSVYNLTKMYRQDEEMERFLADMTRFLGYTDIA